MLQASVGHLRPTNDFMVCLMCCSGLQSLQQPMERLLVVSQWLKMHWPGEEKQILAMDERDSSMAVRLAFIVRSFLGVVQEARISMHNIDTYDYWTVQPCSHACFVKMNWSVLIRPVNRSSAVSPLTWCPTLPYQPVRPSASNISRCVASSLRGNALCDACSLRSALQEPLDLLIGMCTDAIRELVLTLYSPGPSASAAVGAASPFNPTLK